MRQTAAVSETRSAAALCRTGFAAGAIGAAIMAVAMTFGGEARAQSAPDTENGRFVLSPVADGFLRLDTRSGAMSTCTNTGGWTCRMIADERAALDTEIGRLQADNQRLKDQLAQRDTVSGKTGAPLAKEDSSKSTQVLPDSKASPDGKAPDKKIELQLPPEHEKLLALIDRVWDRLIGMAVRLQKKLSENI